MGKLDMAEVNNRPLAHARGRRSTHDFLFWGPVVCFVSFLIASVFMVRVKSAESNVRVKNKKSKSGRKKATKNVSSNVVQNPASDNRADYTMV